MKKTLLTLLLTAGTSLSLLHPVDAKANSHEVLCKYTYTKVEYDVTQNPRTGKYTCKEKGRTPNKTGSFKTRTQRLSPPGEQPENWENDSDACEREMKRIQGKNPCGDPTQVDIHFYYAGPPKATITDRTDSSVIGVFQLPTIGELE